MLDVPAGGDLQAAIKSISCGGTIRLQAGATYVGWFALTPKSCTGTDADYITVTSNGMLPAPGTRLDPAAFGGQLAHLVSPPGAGYPVLYTQNGNVHHWRFVGVDFTSDATSYTPAVVLIAAGDNIQGGYPTFEDRKKMIGFVFDRCFIHPPEISWDKLTTTVVNHHAIKGITIQAVDWQIINSYIGGFFGGGPNGESEATDGILSDTAAKHGRVENCYVEAFYSNVFIGGSDMLPLPEHQATMTGGAAIGTITLSQHQDLAVGDLLAMQCTGCSRQFAVGKVTAITGNVVTYTPMTGLYQNFAGAPTEGGTAQWRGDQMDDIVIRHNTLAKPAYMCQAMPGAYTKNWFELKAGLHVTVEGNVMTACVESNWALTVRNQNGSSPWVEVSNLTVRNNYASPFKDPALGVLMTDNEAVTGPSRDWEFSNNLLTGDQYAAAFGVSGPGSNVVVKHNTFLGSKIGYGQSLVPGFTFLDNIFRVGPYGGPGCYINGNAASTTDCWPTYPANVNHNVAVDNSGLGTASVAASFPNDMYAASDTAVGWTDQANRNFRLAATSPFKGKASDGADPGIDQDTLEAAIGPVMQLPPMAAKRVAAIRRQLAH